MTTQFKSTAIRPIWYARKWSIRTTIVFTTMDAIVAGFFLGVALVEYLRGGDVLRWVFPLVMAFTTALTTLRGLFVVLRNCPQPTKAARSEPTLDNARA
jgi:hypothetical protein